MIFTENSPLWRFARFIARRAMHYNLAFKTPDGQAVLIDLAKFCFANAPCSNDREQGRRDVWLRIRQHLDLSPDELTVLFAKLPPEQRHQLYNPGGATYLEE